MFANCEWIPLKTAARNTQGAAVWLDEGVLGWRLSYAIFRWIPQCVGESSGNILDLWWFPHETQTSTQWKWLRKATGKTEVIKSWRWWKASASSRAARWSSFGVGAGKHSNGHARYNHAPWGVGEGLWVQGGFYVLIVWFWKSLCKLRTGAICPVPVIVVIAAAPLYWAPMCWVCRPYLILIKTLWVMVMFFPLTKEEPVGQGD